MPLKRLSTFTSTANSSPLRKTNPPTPQTSASYKDASVLYPAFAQNRPPAEPQTTFESIGVLPVPSNPNQAVATLSSTPSKQLGNVPQTSGGVRLP